MQLSSEHIQKPQSYFHALDLLRWLAAFTVVFSHARSCFLQDNTPVVSRGGWKAFYFISNFGHQAVIVFFVLSGCVVGRIVVNAVRKGTWSWKVYGFDRITRLWIVLIPALFLTVFWDTCSIWLSTPESFPHGGGEYAKIFTRPFEQNLTVATFFGNITFLQTILVPTLGCNGPLWSLANEFWYYIIFPLLLTGVVGKKSLASRGVLIGGGVAILFGVGYNIASLFPIWLLGVLSYWVFLVRPPQGGGIFLGTIITLAVFGGALIVARFGHTSGNLLSDYAVGMSCAWLVYFLLAVKPPNIISRVSAFFSKFSYSVYLLHLPPIALISALMIGTDKNRFAPSLESLILLGGVILSVYGYSYLIFLFTENRTQTLRVVLRSLFFGTHSGSRV